MKLLHPFNGLFSKTTSLSRHQKGKPFLISMRQKMIKWQWHQLDHMQIICTSFQTDNHTSASSLSTDKPDAIPDSQLTQNKHTNSYVRYETTMANTHSVITWEQNDMSLKCRSKITVFLSRLISVSSFSPTCRSIVLFRVSVASDDEARARWYIANLCRSILPPADTTVGGSFPWWVFCESLASYRDSRELPLASPSAPDIWTASAFCVVAPINASSDSLLKVLSMLDLKPHGRAYDAWDDSSFSQTDMTLSRSAGRLWTLASLSSRFRHPVTDFFPLDNAWK